MICNECFLTRNPNVGLVLNEERGYIKCYMGHIGLLVSHAFDENELTDAQLYQQIMHDKLSINQGMLYENAIAQMLIANGHKLYFYTKYNKEKHRNDIKIDFIISNNSKLKYILLKLSQEKIIQLHLLKNLKKDIARELENVILFIQKIFGKRIESHIFRLI